jgi:hypothetical protein
MVLNVRRHRNGGMRLGHSGPCVDVPSHGRRLPSEAPRAPLSRLAIQRCRTTGCHWAQSPLDPVAGCPVEDQHVPEAPEPRAHFVERVSVAPSAGVALGRVRRLADRSRVQEAVPAATAARISPPAASRRQTAARSTYASAPCRSQGSSLGMRSSPISIRWAIVHSANGTREPFSTARGFGGYLGATGDSFGVRALDVVECRVPISTAASACRRLPTIVRSDTCSGARGRSASLCPMPLRASRRARARRRRRDWRAEPRASARDSDRRAVSSRRDRQQAPLTIRSEP